MADTSGHKTEVGILAHVSEANALGDATWPSDQVAVETCEEGVTGPLGRLLEREPDVVIVAGGDRLVGRVVEAYQRRHELRTHPLRIYAAESEGPSRLADQLGNSRLGSRLVRKLLAKTGRTELTPERIPSMKVTVSSRPAALYGFNLGAGVFYQLFEAYARASGTRTARVTGTIARLGRDTLLEAGANLEPISAKIAVDHRPEAERIGYLLASTLESSWLGLKMGGIETLGLRMGESGAKLARQVASSNTLPDFVRGDAGRTIETIDIDWSSPFVLDGELVEPGRSHVLHVERGPMVHCVQL